MEVVPSHAMAKQPGERRSRNWQVSAVVFTGIVAGSGPALLFVGSMLAWIVTSRLGGPPPLGGDLLAMLLSGWITLACLNRFDVYRLTRMVSYITQFYRVASAILCGAASLAAATAVVHPGLRAPSHLVLTWACLNALFFCVAHTAAVTFAIRLRREGRLARRVALVGATEIGNAFAAELSSRSEHDIHVVGFYDDGIDHIARSRINFPVLGGISQLVTHGQSGQFDAVVITLPANETERVARISDRLSHLALDVFVAPDLSTARPSEVGTLAGLPVGQLARRPLSDWQVVQKLVFDYIFAALMLLALCPAIGLIICLIKLDSPGPVLFRQRRTGFNNMPFDCLKFRTMYHHMADPLADRQTEARDSRITRIGRVLRKLSLDELPQLINVLRGEMSLVGPRPHAPNTKAANRLFNDVVVDYARRHRVKPGITGWAQVRGWRGETATEEAIKQRVLHDMDYIENWSLARDLQIMLITLLRVCDDPKAY